MVAPERPRGVLMGPEAELPPAPFWWPHTRAQWQTARCDIDACYHAYRTAAQAYYYAVADQDELNPVRYSDNNRRLGRAHIPGSPYALSSETLESNVLTARRAMDEAARRIERLGERWGVTLRAG